MATIHRDDVVLELPDYVSVADDSPSGYQLTRTGGSLYRGFLRPARVGTLGGRCRHRGPAEVPGGWGSNVVGVCRIWPPRWPRSAQLSFRRTIQGGKT